MYTAPGHVDGASDFKYGNHAHTSTIYSSERYAIYDMYVKCCGYMCLVLNTIHRFINGV